MYIPGYRIIRKINHGGMSIVYLAIQESVGRVVALKVMSPALNGDPSFSERFQREANIVGQLSHPNIVSIYDIGRHENLNYIAMDYLPGGSIHDKMLSGFSAEEAVDILREMASALNHAHDKGYIHRDIKPENILFRDGGSAVLTDFGVALARNSGPRATHAGTVVGTPHYMSPEQTRGKSSDGRSDLYSLGIVFYEMLTGSVPYQGEEAVAIAIKHLASPLPKLPAQHRRYQDILDKLLDKEPDKRYQTGRELVADIELLQLKMRELGDADSDGANLGHQIQNLTQTIRWHFVTGLSSVSRRLWDNISRLRFSRQQGFYQAAPKLAGLSDFTTRQNTLVATRLQKSTQRPSRWQWLLGIPKQHQLLAAGAASVFLLGLVLLAWLGSGSADTSDRNNKTTVPTVASSSSAPQQPAQSRSAKAQTLADAPANANSAVSNPKRSEANAIAGDDSLALTAPEADPEESFSSAIDSLYEADQPASPATASDPLLDAEHQSQHLELATSEPADEQTDESSLEQSSAASSSVSANYPFRVTPEPQNALVRIMNIRQKYTPGMALKPGRYQLEVSAPGYQKYLRWVTLAEQPLNKTVRLTELRPVGSVFNSALADGGKGPTMVVVPPGSFSMGGTDANTKPIHTVTIKQRFAVSQHEVTFNEYERFAKHNGMPLPGDNRWGRDDRPVINISWEEADLYAQWLTKQTGMHYRLPSEAEWEYLAKSGKKRSYVWGDNVKDASDYANCRRHCSNEYSGFFSAKTAPVGSFSANDFGLYDMAGNVAEWVADCYRDSYRGASPNGAAYKQKNCPARVVRGGSFKADAADTNTYSRQYQPQHTYHVDIGFRLVADLSQ